MKNLGDGSEDSSDGLPCAGCAVSDHCHQHECCEREHRREALKEAAAACDDIAAAAGWDYQEQLANPGAAPSAAGFARGEETGADACAARIRDLIERRK